MAPPLVWKNTETNEVVIVPTVVQEKAQVMLGEDWVPMTNSHMQSAVDALVQSEQGSMALQKAKVELTHVSESLQKNMHLATPPCASPSPELKHVITPNITEEFALLDQDLQTTLNFTSTFLSESMTALLATAIEQFEKHGVLIHIVLRLIQRSIPVTLNVSNSEDAQGLIQECDLILGELRLLENALKDHMDTTEQGQGTLTDPENEEEVPLILQIIQSAILLTSEKRRHLRALLAALPPAPVLSAQTIQDSQQSTETSATHQAAVTSSTALSPADFTYHAALATGGFSTVYVASKKGQQQLYAMKVMSKKRIRELSMQEYINQEKKILTDALTLGSSHPAIVKLHAAFSTSRHLFFVMEFVPGGNFGDLMTHMNGQPLGEETTCFYLTELALAVGFLHSQHIIHRDLKPDNILLAMNGHLKLVDFGLSKLETQAAEGVAASQLSMASESGEYTFDGSLTFGDTSDVSFRPVEANGQYYSPVGSPYYVAPEVIIGSGHGPAVDWWSLGVLAFQMLTGRLPFQGDTAEAVKDSIVAGEIRWPDPESVNPTTRDLVAALLVFEAKNRLGSANDLADLRVHPFFRQVDNWDPEEFYSKPAPFVMQSYDSTALLRNTINEAQLPFMDQGSVEEPKTDDPSQSGFSGFSFVGPSWR